MKSVMKKECGWLTYETFDADLEKLQKKINSARAKFSTEEIAQNKTTPLKGNLSEKELAGSDIDAMFLGRAP
ncbi:hypothetical protein B9Z55_017281 [Caenorhabditis nigoni]|uniref:Uncharacterized protein n=1 Tax=Caenorhabditis nigoni TaxID=1611254 RepID=A0A2G5T900_9PELO|nr:hypothetical protein B9Z55_017281 [Caenorhabditis nigoni]